MQFVDADGVAGLLSVDHRGQEIVSWVASPALDQPGDVLGHRHDRRVDPGEHLAGEIRPAERHGDVSGPGVELIVVVGGNAERRTHDQRGKRVGERGHELVWRRLLDRIG